MARKAQARVIGRYRDLPHERSRQQASTQSSSREYYEERYKKVKAGPLPTNLFAEGSMYQINRMERLWREYCTHQNLDPYHTLKKCQPARIENFFHWLLQSYTVGQTSSLETYWHQLSEVYINWKGRRINPMKLKQVLTLIRGPLTSEHRLNDKASDKPVLEVEDLMKVLQCHWGIDTSVYPIDRHRVQVANILLLAGCTGSRPSALLNIKYKDLELFVQLDEKTGRTALLLMLALRETKSHQKRGRPKTYTFNLDDNPALCSMTHFITLASDDNAFAAPDLSCLENLFRLGVKNGLMSQAIPWKREMLDRYVFRKHEETKDGIRISADERLPYAMYHSWVKRLGEETGFLQILTTYCIRRATGNAVNDHPESNDAVRNLIMDHSNNWIFERNYLSRQIRFDTQAAYMGTVSNRDMIRAAGRMSRLMDPRRPKKLSEPQKEALKQLLYIQELYDYRDYLYKSIRRKHGFLQNAEGLEIHDEYDAVKRRLRSSLDAEEKALLAEIKADYDATAAVKDIQDQLNGADLAGQSIIVPQRRQLVFAERSRIADALEVQASYFTGHDGFDKRIGLVYDLLALCSLCERRKPRKRGRPTKALHSEDDPLSEGLKDDSDSSANSVKVESPEPEHYPLECDRWQCLFCLGNTQLPADERRKDYASKFSLWRHMNRCRLKLYGVDDMIPCPHPHPQCDQVKLHGHNHLRVHAIGVHKVDL